jgi:hypothetical protein
MVSDNDIEKQRDPFAAALTAGAPRGTSLTGALQRGIASRGGRSNVATSNMENLAETAAVGEGTASVAQAAQAAAPQIEAQKLQAAAQREQIAAQGEQLAEKATDIRRRYEQGANKIASEASIAGRKLSMAEDKDKAEHVARASRLSNEKYITTLQRQGQLSRLESDLEFRKAAVQAQIEAARTATQTAINNMIAEAGDERDFLGQLSKISIDDWLSNAKYEGKLKSAQGMSQGITGIVEGGAKAYEKFG